MLLVKFWSCLIFYGTVSIYFPLDCVWIVNICNPSVNSEVYKHEKFLPFFNATPLIALYCSISGELSTCSECSSNDCTHCIAQHTPSWQSRYLDNHSYDFHCIKDNRKYCCTNWKYSSLIEKSLTLARSLENLAKMISPRKEKKMPDFQDKKCNRSPNSVKLEVFFISIL